MKVPTINIGGWYDIFSQGNIDCFVGLQNRARRRPRAIKSWSWARLGTGGCGAI